MTLEHAIEQRVEAGRSSLLEDIGKAVMARRNDRLLSFNRDGIGGPQAIKEADRYECRLLVWLLMELEQKAPRK